ncbi:MAG TPA: NAD(P)-dependent oxidoreductase [Candidatus Bathyarchaeia archaeon]|nr:NAD(P)-dependent oxidoreductase [Candidatus Bathyarchaeia archaeon]
MKQFFQISTINTLNLTENVEAEIQKYSQKQVIFYPDDSKTEDETVLRIGQSDAVLGSWNSTITKKVLDACPNLKYIGICGTSLTNVDVEEVTKHKIILKNVVDYGDEATAEFIFAQLLNLFRGFGKYQLDTVPSELNGKTIGIIGLGAVGQQVAKRALGFSMNVIYYSRTRNSEWENKGLTYKDLNTLLSEADVISLNVPRNLNIIGQNEFSLIKPKAVLVNTAIGNVFDLPSLIKWISKGNNFFIVDNQEYFDQIKDLPNVIALPVTAGKTRDTVNRLSKKVIENLKSFLDTN